jgi:hypothetical protein
MILIPVTDDDRFISMSRPACRLCGEAMLDSTHHPDPTMARARKTLKENGIHFGMRINFTPLCPHKRDKVDCDTCAILALWDEMDRQKS